MQSFFSLQMIIAEALQQYTELNVRSPPSFPAYMSMLNQKKEEEIAAMQTKRLSHNQC